MVRRIVASPAMDAAETSFSPLAVRGPRWDSRLTVLILFLPPALVLFTLFVVLPVGEAAWYSAFNWNGFGRPTNWIDLTITASCLRRAPSGLRCVTTD